MYFVCSVVFVIRPYDASSNYVSYYLCTFLITYEVPGSIPRVHAVLSVLPVSVWVCSGRSSFQQILLYTYVPY